MWRRPLKTHSVEPVIPGILDASVYHTDPAILSNPEVEPAAATALEVTLPPRRELHLSTQTDTLELLRRDLRRSTERYDCSMGGPPEFEASPGTADKRSFRSRRLTKEADDDDETKSPPKTAARVEEHKPDHKGGSILSRTLSALHVTSSGTKLPANRLPEHGMLCAVEFDDLSDTEVAHGLDWNLAHGLDSSNVAMLSCHGAEPARRPGAAMSNKINQDCACAGIGGQSDSALFCVYDGHGKFGREVSQFAMTQMYEHLARTNAELLRRRPMSALATSFAEVEEELRTSPHVDSSESGACACVAYLHNRMLWVAGAGDTRTVLGTCCDGVLAAVALSTDHKASVPSEVARIQAAGGYIKAASSSTGPARVYMDAQMTEGRPGLTPSRSLGDSDAIACGIVATPEIIRHELSANDRFLIMASDGVWEFISSSEAVEIVDAFYTHGKPVAEACSHLIATAARAWLEVEGDYRDDITACIVWLQPVADGLQKAAEDEEGGMGA